MEISAVKHDEALKMRLQLEQIRTELEQSYQQRLAIYDEKENHQKQALLDSERRIQQLEYESRQRIQRELDEIRTREEATRRKNEMELQTTRLLETRLKEMQVSISRLIFVNVSVRLSSNHGSGRLVEEKKNWNSSNPK